MRNRKAISQVIDGANAAATEKTPKISRLTWNETRRPKRSDITPATHAPIIKPRNVDDRNQPFSVRLDWPLLTKAASTAPASV